MSRYYLAHIWAYAKAAASVAAAAATLFSVCKLLGA